MTKIRALTLIELMVSIGIAVLILAVSIPLLSYDKKGALVSSEAELVKSYLETAKSLAIHPESENATAYRVKIMDDGKTINTVRLENITENDVLDKKLALNYSVPDKFDSIDFAAYTGEYTKNDIDIKLCLKKDSSVCKIIKVTKPGVIKIQ